MTMVGGEEVNGLAMWVTVKEDSGGGGGGGGGNEGDDGPTSGQIFTHHTQLLQLITTSYPPLGISSTKSPHTIVSYKVIK